jgi:beta-glucosidase
MSDIALAFPPGFLWGTATAPVQNEGSFENSTWYPWERRPGTIRNGDRSGIGCDWWRHAEADFDLAVDLGNNAMRLGVEWSRIEPQEGSFDPHALARYREILHGLRERGIEPLVTLHHFSDPLWLEERGGWRSPQAPRIFRRFVSHVVEELGDLVSLWVTINEPMVYVFDGFLSGRRAPGHRGLASAVRAARHLLQAHGEAYQAIHARQESAQVGIANHYLCFDPADTSRLGDRLGAGLLDHLFNGYKLAAQTSGRLQPPFGLGLSPYAPLVDSVDFLGVNYYSRARVFFAPGSEAQFAAWRLADPPADAAQADLGLDGFMAEIYPEGLLRALRRLAVYGKPVYITENGVGDRLDRVRPRALVDHLVRVHRALQEGIDVRGYFHWTLVDNFEWNEGWQLRFGLVELDPQTQARRPRPSARLYQRICQANGLPLDLLPA